MRQREANAKNKKDTGGGCSICGSYPAIDVEGSYRLCGSCVLERLEENAQLRDNYTASQELLAIREEQVGELLKEKLRTALDEARERLGVVDSLREIEAAMMSLGYTLLAERIRYIANSRAAWLEKYPKV